MSCELRDMRCGRHNSPFASHVSPIYDQCITHIAFHATGEPPIQPRHFSTLRPLCSDARMALMASTDDPRLSSDLKQLLQTDAAATAQLLVRVTAVTDQVAEAIEAAGFQIHLRLTLVPTFAVSGPVAGVRALLGQPWLRHIELDRPAHTQ